MRIRQRVSVVGVGGEVREVVRKVGRVQIIKDVMGDVRGRVIQGKGVGRKEGRGLRLVYSRGRIGSRFFFQGNSYEIIKLGFIFDL